MLRADELAARSAMAVVLAMTLWCAPRAMAQPSTSVAVGAVAASEGGATAARELSRALADVVGARPDVRLTPRRRADLVLRGSIVRMERTRVDGGVEVRCEVSVVVTDGGGSIRAMLRGRGGARGDGDVAHLSRDALRAAVRGALRRLAAQRARIALAR